MVFCTEKSAAVYSLPSQRQMYTQTINESTFVVSKISNFTIKKIRFFFRENLIHTFIFCLQLWSVKLTFGLKLYLCQN